MYGTGFIRNTRAGITAWFQNPQHPPNATQTKSAGKGKHAKKDQRLFSLQLHLKRIAT